MFHGSLPIPFTHLKCAHMTTSLSSQVVQYLLLCFSILKGHHPRPTAACCQPQTLTYMLNPYRGTKRRPVGAPHLFGQSYYATSDLLLPKKITAQSNGECRHATGFWLLDRVHPTRYCTDLRVVCVVGASPTFRPPAGCRFPRSRRCSRSIFLGKLSFSGASSLLI